MKTIEYDPACLLECPNCGTPAIASSNFGCVFAGDHDCDEECVQEPIWEEGDGGTCPECGVTLVVRADGKHAHLEIR